MTLILGIETSCDETAASVVNDKREILSNIILSQVKDHEIWGGVVPEIAARSHMDNLAPTIKAALKEAKVTIEDLDAIAVTAGPGLIGGVLVGVMMAKAMAAASNKPIIAVNHLEGHALTARLTDNAPFPFLLILASGGHCQILVAEAVGKYTKLGGTIDDAAGEAFDKVAKMLGMTYPGGPKIEQYAKLGNELKYNFPKPLIGHGYKENCDFSFSGLKTAVRREIEKAGEITEQVINDISASFQYTVAEIFATKLQIAIDMCKADIKTVVIAGGVAANVYIGDRLREVVAKNNLNFVAPPLKLCTDNAAMIAWAGLERFEAGMIDDLTFTPKARWPLFT